MRLSGREDLNLPFGPNRTSTRLRHAPICVFVRPESHGRTPAQGGEISTTSRSRHEKTTAAVSVVAAFILLHTLVQSSWDG